MASGTSFTFQSCPKVSFSPFESHSWAATPAVSSMYALSGHFFLEFYHGIIAEPWFHADWSQSSVCRCLTSLLTRIRATRHIPCSSNDQSLDLRTHKYVGLLWPSSWPLVLTSLYIWSFIPPTGAFWRRIAIAICCNRYPAFDHLNCHIWIWRWNPLPLTKDWAVDFSWWVS